MLKIAIVLHYSQVYSLQLPRGRRRLSIICQFPGWRLPVDLMRQCFIAA